MIDYISVLADAFVTLSTASNAASTAALQSSPKASLCSRHFFLHFLSTQMPFQTFYLSTPICLHAVALWLFAISSLRLFISSVAFLNQSLQSSSVSGYVFSRLCPGKNIIGGPYSFAPSLPSFRNNQARFSCCLWQYLH